MERIFFLKLCIDNGRSMEDSRRAAKSVVKIEKSEAHYIKLMRIIVRLRGLDNVCIEKRAAVRVSNGGQDSGDESDNLQRICAENGENLALSMDFTSDLSNLDIDAF